ncbi:peroxiredoxin [Clostridium sp. LY3-2]|uniref:peroxiredoxin n=1 Tax=Clostridium sp. LY3-2 TaxID=2942482 RepID=UPI002152AF30|nr:peroxiredoxin [Clostridium sp. LY3-2]MCR6515459.1 peroxiredoxin [Clostridium sp. LY3-2]
MELKVGMIAPEFKLMGSDNKEHSLKDYKGKRVILYFYPKDNTPGCSLEAQDFKNHYESFIDNNTVVLGVSRDNLKSHEKFINKYDLPFVLLSDEDEVVCRLYDVLKEKNMFGKKVFGIERSTFVVDEEGKIIDIYRKVKVKGHVESLL